VKIDAKEVLRYMRAKDSGEQFLPVIDEVSSYLIKNIIPIKSIGFYDIEKTDNGVCLIGTGVEFRGNLVTARLKHSSRIALVTATLGIKSENYLASLAANMLKSLAADAAMSAMLESYLDDIESEIRASQASNGYTVSGRFSAGYGDFSITAQKDIIRLLNAEKLLGVRLKESYMLYPNKSVTAIIGIGKEEVNSSGCANCNNNSSCGYKK